MTTGLLFTYFQNPQLITEDIIITAFEALAEGIVSFRQGCTLHPAVVVHIGLMRGKAKKTDHQ